MKKILPIIAILFILTACTPANITTQAVVDVFYAGETGSVQTALQLAERSNQISLVEDLAAADVIFLNGIVPDPGKVAERLQAGAGLVLVLGPEVTSDAASTILGHSVNLTALDNPVSLTNAAGVNDTLLTEVLWNGAPQVRERIRVDGQELPVKALVSTYEDNEPILWQLSDNAYIFNASLDGTNPQIQEWAYYNYLIYHLTERAAGITPLSFADYPASPVPHSSERNVIFIFLAFELVGTFGIFILVRRYSVRHPEALDNLVADKSRFQTHEAGTAWERVGFHRPLSGLIVGMSLGVILFIPLVIYQNLILPQFILPSAQALGIWGRVTQFFNLTWVIFDMGTAAAAMKFLSQYRVTDPRQGFKYLQVYVWWQALSGAIQVALVISATSIGIVKSPYAIYAWSIIIHALIQIPGFYQVMRNTLNGLQRSDYARYIDVAYGILLPIITQVAVVPLFYLWGKNNPQIGGALGGVLGLGVAVYLLELLCFLLALWLYRRMGYKANVIFMAHFDWKIIKQAFKFGIFEMLGGTIASAGAAAEIWLTQTRLINYAEIWGNWVLAQNFVFAFTVTTNLFDGLMPAISEAVSNGYKKLSQYYSVQSYKWGGIASGFLTAVLLAVAPRFIIGSSGMEFQRAAIYVVPLVLCGAIQYPAWLSDSLFLGSNKPGLRAVMIFGEQTLRVALILLLLVRFQIIALIAAYFISLLIRDYAGYRLNHKICFPQRFYFWQSFAAIVLAAGAHFLLMTLLAKVIWKGDEITSIILFLIGILPSLPFYLFFYALFGGWDEGALEELKEAVSLTGFLHGFANVMFYLPSKWGSKISPLYNRFPVTIRTDALAEAKALTDAKVKLVQG